MAVVTLSSTATAAHAAPFVVKVTDDATARGVPMVMLRTDDQVRWFTDSGGVAAIDDPTLNGQRIYLNVSSPGYSMKGDGFGNHGQAVDVTPDKAVEIKVHRDQIAQRVYRLTGAGIYRDTVLAGLKPPIARPILDGKVVGQDSCQAAVYHDRVYWFFGDTAKPDYPLGQFGTSGATSKLPDADVGVDLDYFVDKTGFSRPMLPKFEKGAAWVDGLFVANGKMYCKCDNVPGVGKVFGRYLTRYDDREDRFESIQTIPLDAKLFPNGQAFESDGYVYFASPFPRQRVAVGDVEDLSKYEAVAVKDDVTDAATGKPIRLHAGSVRWNPYFKKFLMIANRNGGEKSNLGEVYLTTAEVLTGPWAPCVKIADHGNYSFYNPVQHDFLDQGGGRIVYFQGTLSVTFSTSSDPIPRYDYNQLVYKVDLADKRIPVPR